MGDPATAFVGLVCSNQAWVASLLALFMAHTGFSVLSAILKKTGVSSGTLVQIIRLLAIDVKPPAAQIVAQAQTIQASPETHVPQAAVDAQKGS